NSSRKIVVLDAEGLEQLRSFDIGSGALDITIDGKGNIFVCFRDHSIRVFDRDGKLLRKWGSHGTGPGQFNTAISIALDASKDEVYVTDMWNHRVQVFSSEGKKFLRQWGQGAPAMDSSAIRVASQWT